MHMDDKVLTNSHQIHGFFCVCNLIIGFIFVFFLQIYIIYITIITPFNKSLRTQGRKIVKEGSQAHIRNR